MYKLARNNPHLFAMNVTHKSALEFFSPKEVVCLLVGGKCSYINGN